MIGNRVRIYLLHGDWFEGTLLAQDTSGVTVHNQQGLNNERRFIPHQRIDYMKDLGRAP